MADETESDDELNAPEGWNDEAVEMMAGTAEAKQPDSVDPDQKSRQDEGWVKFYVECPDCEVPMHKTTTEGEEIADYPDFIRSASETRYRLMCPECKTMMTHLQIRRVTATADDIKAAYEEIVSMKDALVDAMKSAVSD